MNWQATPQRLDPLGGVTAQYFTWSVALVAIIVACVQSVRHAGDINSAALEGLALLCIAAAAAVVMDGSSPRRFPFGRARHASVHLLALIAIVLDRASRSAGEGQSAAWGAVCLAILLMTIGSYRPAPEIVLFSLASSLAVAATTIGFAGDLTAGQSAVFAIDRAAPIAAVGLGAAAFSRTLVARLTVWQRGSDERAATTREAIRAELLAEVSRDRQELIEHRVGPFLQELLDRGTVTPADIARARGLATALRRTMLAEARRSWLDDLADTVEDPDHLAERMTPEQRTAFGGLISELRAVAQPLPGSMLVTLGSTGAAATARLTARFGTAHSRLRDSAYVAVLRTCFRHANVTVEPSGIAVELEFDAGV